MKPVSLGEEVVDCYFIHENVKPNGVKESPGLVGLATLVPAISYHPVVASCGLMTTHTIVDPFALGFSSKKLKVSVR